MNKKEVITIKWTDSNQYNHQTTPEIEKYDIARFITTGFLVKETDDYCVVARECLNGGDVRGVIVIPKVNIY